MKNNNKSSTTKAMHVMPWCKANAKKKSRPEIKANAPQHGAMVYGVCVCVCTVYTMHVVNSHGHTKCD